MLVKIIGFVFLHFDSEEVSKTLMLTSRDKEGDGKPIGVPICRLCQK